MATAVEAGGGLGAFGATGSLARAVMLTVSCGVFGGAA